MIKTTPFINPFRNVKKQNGNKVKIVSHKGQTYEKVVRKK